MCTTEFHGSVVLVTGAAGGIGQAIGLAFEARGATVYRTDIRPGTEPRFITGDIADPQFPRRCVDQLLREAGRIDVLVNNAGICPRTALPDITAEEWKRVLDINLTSSFLLGQACMAAMVPRKSGAIISLASLAGKVGGIAVGAHYSASKAAIICLTKTLARYGAPHGVRANAVAPGVIQTEMTAAATPEAREALAKSIPLGRFGTPEEVAETIVFLASKAAGYITGVTLDINGGLLMD
jgi:3-oxoacyl-[acyl-carrier protein] reductase